MISTGMCASVSDNTITPSLRRTLKERSTLGSVPYFHVCSVVLLTAVVVKLALGDVDSERGNVLARVVHALHAARQCATRGQVQRAQRGAAAQQAGQRFQVHARTGQVQLSKKRAIIVQNCFANSYITRKFFHAHLDPQNVL
jgi:hypothetical protein